MIKLKELRKEKGITQNKLAHDINLARSTISMYENGLSEPNLEILIQLSKYFNVSTDCLLGLDNSMSQEPLFALLNEENRNKINSLAESLLKAQNGTEPLKLNDELTLLINELDEQQKEQLIYFIKGMLQASTKNYIKV